MSASIRNKRERSIRLLLIVAAVSSTCVKVNAQSDANVNEANNPLTPKITLNLQDQFVGSYYGLDGTDSNTGLIRGVIPHKLFGLPQILRFTLPIPTTPELPDHTTGLGDFNVFDLVVFKGGKLELGIGPQLTVPTATDNSLGTGKWQGGIATVAIAPQKWGLVGSLVTWQHSFAGPDGRADQQNLAIQPLIIYNLPQGYYLRSTAGWNFDLETGHHYIPIGAGAGKVWALHDGTTINAFIEPQYTVAHDGLAPQWQVFAGVNFQFPLRSTSTPHPVYAK